MKTSPEMPNEAQFSFLFYSTHIETTESHKFAFSKGARLQVSVLMNFFGADALIKKSSNE